MGCRNNCSLQLDQELLVLKDMAVEALWDLVAKMYVEGLGEVEQNK